MNRPELTISLFPSQTVPQGDTRRIRALERTIGELREQIRHLEELLAPRVELPTSWKLTPTQTRLFQALLARETLSKTQALHALSTVDGELRAEKYVCVQIWHIRSKLTRHGVEIETAFGHGYRLKSRLSWRAKLGCKSAGPGISPPEPAPQ